MYGGLLMYTDTAVLVILQYLDMSNNMITDVSALSKCPSLVQVDLSFNAIEVNTITPHLKPDTCVDSDLDCMALPCMPV
jgi:Ran GTPase-activating protein (RanGAP) involved in mRNA processing and transport